MALQKIYLFLFSADFLDGINAKYVDCRAQTASKPNNFKNWQKQSWKYKCTVLAYWFPKKHAMFIRRGIWEREWGVKQKWFLLLWQNFKWQKNIDLNMIWEYFLSFVDPVLFISYLWQKLREKILPEELQVAKVFPIQMFKKITLQVNIFDTDYGHTMAKFLIICCPNSNPK